MSNILSFWAYALEQVGFVLEDAAERLERLGL